MDAVSAIRLSTSRGLIEVHDSGGPGPVVLVVHGMPGDWRQGQTVTEDLVPAVRVLRVSRPGYGRTPLSSGPTPASSADLYAALLDALGLDDVAVLGISGGGPSAYAFAQRHPDRCRGLLLCCALQPHLMSVPPAMLRLAAVPGLWSVVAGLGRLAARVRPPALPEPATLTTDEQALLKDPRVHAALARFLREGPSSLSGRGLRNDVRQLRATHGVAPADWPVTSQVLVVVLHGDLDEVVPLQHAQDYAARIPGARLEVLTGLGHAVPLFARERVTTILTELVRQGNARP